MEEYLIAIIIVISFFLLPKATAKSLESKVYSDMNYQALDADMLRNLYVASELNNKGFFNTIYNLFYSIAFIVVFGATAIGAYKYYGLVGTLIASPFVLASIVFFIFNVITLIKLLRK